MHNKSATLIKKIKLK